MRHAGKRIPVLSNSIVAVVLTLAAAPALAGVNVWTAQGPAPQVFAIARDPVDPLTLYAGTLSGAFKTTDGGNTWSQLAPQNTALTNVRKILVDPRLPSRIYALTPTQVLRSDDLGSHWQEHAAPQGAIALAADPRGPEIYVGTGRSHKPEGSVYPPTPVSKSSDGGATWTAMGLRRPRAVYSILVDSLHGAIFAGSDFSYAQGYYGDYDSQGGGIEETTDGGLTWSLSPVDLQHSVTALAIDPAGTRMYAGTSSGEVFRSTDRGDSWVSLRRHIGTVSAIVVDPSSPDDIFVATRGSGVYRLLHTGFVPTWKPLNAGLSDGHVTSLIIDPSGKILHAGTAVGVYDIELEEEPGSACSPGLTHLCLFGSLFRVELTAIDPRTGVAVPGLAVPQETNFGYFSLPSLTGDPTLPEVMVKMVDARSLPGGGFWVLYSGLTSVVYSLVVTDTSTGHPEEYDGRDFCGGADTTSFPAGPSASAEATSIFEGNLMASGPELRLLNERFRLTLSVQNPWTGLEVSGVAIPQADRFGYFSLPALTGDPNFPEVFVKMLDATSLPEGHFWVFHASLTTLAYELTVTDSLTGESRTYRDDASDPTHVCGGADTGSFPGTGAALAGRWAGSVRDSGLTDEFFCPPRTNSVSFDIAQTGDAVRFDVSFHGLCSGSGTLTFQGYQWERNGSLFLSGQLRKEAEPGSCALKGDFSGPVDGSRIALSGSLSGPCNSVGMDIGLTR